MKYCQFRINRNLIIVRLKDNENGIVCSRIIAQLQTINIHSSAFLHHFNFKSFRSRLLFEKYPYRNVIQVYLFKTYKLTLFPHTRCYNSFRELYPRKVVNTGNRKFPQGLPAYYQDRLRVTSDWLSGSFKTN